MYSQLAVLLTCAADSGNRLRTPGLWWGCEFKVPARDSMEKERTEAAQRRWKTQMNMLTFLATIQVEEKRISRTMHACVSKKGSRTPNDINLHADLPNAEAQGRRFKRGAHL